MSLFFDIFFLNSLLRVFLFTPIFLFALFVAFYIPGSILLQKINYKNNSYHRIAISVTLGMVLWAYQGIIFGYLGLRFMTYIYLAIFVVIWIMRRRIPPLKKLKKIRIGKVSIGKVILTTIFIIGVFGQNQQFAVTAFEFKDGIRVFTWSADDTFWHSGLTYSLTQSVPPIEPGMSGVEVKNYHYWSNLVIAEITRVFHLPLLMVQYLYMGIFISLLLGWLAFILGRSLGFKSFALIILVYLQYFASDVIYLITLITQKAFIFTVHPLEDGTMLLENPPRAFSFVVMLLALILLFEWIKSRNTRLGWVIVFVVGCIIGFKVHTGALALLGILFLSLYLVFNKRWKDLYIICAFIVSIIIYLPVNAAAGSAVFVPFDLTSRTFAVQSLVGLSNFELARRVYLDHKNYLQAFRMDMMMVIFFVFAQFGIKCLGFIPLKRVIKHLSFPVWIYLYGSACGSFLLGLLFIQPVAPADTFNFLLAGSFFLAILTASFIQVVMKNKLVIICFVVLLLFMTVPRFIYKASTFSVYFKPTAPVFSREEIDATRFLKNISGKKVVLVLNKGQWDSHFSYVSFLSEKDMFLSGQVIMSRHGIDFSDREAIVDLITNSTDSIKVRKMLLEQKIDYLYFYGKYNLQVKPLEIGIQEVFENNFISIYRIEK